MTTDQGSQNSQNSQNKETPIWNVLAQYVKDLSFESPNVPQILRPRDTPPLINIDVSVTVNTMGDNNYDVVLTLNAKASENENVIFNTELVYGGLFKLQHFPQEHLTPILFVECPRILFPFARQIIAETTRNGGFPPLMIDPIDFNTLFQRQLADDNAKVQQQAETGNNPQQMLN